MECLDLFWTMFKVGACTFGGGYAMISILQRELVDKKKWITGEDLLDYMAISQITPGVIAVNVSTFVGHKKKGFFGSLAATLGVVTPSIIIILIIASVLSNFYDNVYVQRAFAGIRIAVCALIVNAVINFLKKTVVDVLSIIVFAAVFIVAAFTTFQTVYIVLVIIALGIIYTLIKGNKKPETGKEAGK